MLSTRVLAIGLFLGISLPTFVSAQTIISGPIFDGSGGPLVPAGSPYVVPAASFITVPAGQTLTVQPGVEIRLGDNAYAEVYGTLTADATTVNPIRITASAAGVNWFSLIVRSGGSASLRSCDISSGGRGGVATISAQDAVTLKLDQSRVRLGLGDGLAGSVGQTGAANLAITNNTFSNNAGDGIDLSRGNFATITIADNALTTNTGAGYHLGPDIYPSGGSLTGNGFDGIDLLGGSTTLTGTYEHNLLVNAFAPISVTAAPTLTLAPGVEVRLRKEGTYFEVFGRLKAEGTALNHVRFVPAVPGSNWQALIFRGGSAGSLRFCDLESGMLSVQDAANVTVDQSTLRLAASDGLQGFVGNAVPSTLTVTNCVFAENGSTGVNLTRGPLGTVTLSNNTFTSNVGSAYHLGPDIYPTGGGFGGNGFNGIDLVGGAVSVSGTYAHDLLFNAFAPVIVPAGKTLTIAAGVDCRFMQGGTYLDVSGELRAEGTSTDFIRFMPHVTGQHWQAVILRSGSTARLRYCDLIGGGSAMLVVQDATDVLVDHSILRYSIGEGMSGLIGAGVPSTLTVTNCDLVNNGATGCNLRLGPSGTLNMTCNTFSGNGGDGLWLDGAAALTSNSFFNNAASGLVNMGASVIDARNNWWGNASGPGGIGPGTGDEIKLNGTGSVVFTPWALTPSFPACIPVLDAGTRGSMAFRLYPCAPNPVRRVAMIRFDLPRAAHVRLAVYDLQGREVGIVADGVQPAGSTTLRFDTSGLQSGIYFYRLDSEGFRDTKRMVLMLSSPR